VVGNFSDEMVGVYEYGGNGAFVDRAALSRVGYPTLLTLTFGVTLFDAELDGDLDLLIANGHVYPERLERQDKSPDRQRPQLFMIRGDGVFDEAPHASGVLSQPLVARGPATADFDRDGDLDVLLTENGGPVHLWRNEARSEGYGPGFLRVRLSGAPSNRQGIGAQVEAVVGGVRQIRRVRTGSSYLSQSERVVTIGLGAAAVVDTLWVKWPSGAEGMWEGLEGDREVLLREGSEEVETLWTADGPVP
jgi:hypothetical protein